MEHIKKEPAGTVDAVSFSILLYPHRSLKPHSFIILMGVAGTASALAGISFLLMGAWPVVAFFGLDFLLLFGAFQLNFRAGKRREFIEIRDGFLNVTHVEPNGECHFLAFQAYWSRLVMREGRLFISSHGKAREIASFLHQQEKQEVKEVVCAALKHYTEGPGRRS